MVDIELDRIKSSKLDETVSVEEVECEIDEEDEMLACKAEVPEIETPGYDKPMMKFEIPIEIEFSRGFTE